MAFDSLIGYADATLTAPAAPPPTYTNDSFIGYDTTILSAPAGPYSSSLIGFATVKLTAPPGSYRPVVVKTPTGWRRAAISVYDATTDIWA